MSSKPLIQPFILHFFKITILIFSTHSPSGRSSPPLVSVYPTLFSNAFFHSLSYIPFISYMLTSFSTSYFLQPYSILPHLTFYNPLHFLTCLPNSSLFTPLPPSLSSTFSNAFFHSLPTSTFFYSLSFYTPNHS